MRFGRARYVTLCQQSLVTAAVLAVGVSAAGVKTLDIVPQPGAFAGTPTLAPGGIAPGGVPQDALTKRAEAPKRRTEVNSAPVTPRVREIRVTGISRKTDQAPGATEGGSSSPSTTEKPRATPSPTRKPTPKKAPQEPPNQAPQQSPADKRLVALSDPHLVRGYATVGVTWNDAADYGDEDVAVQVRTETNGTWSGWMDAEYHDEHGPDGGSAEEAARAQRPGTDALVIGDVDRVQMRAETTDGTTPPDLKLAVVDPGTGTMTKQAPAIDTAKLPPPTDPDASTGPQATGADASGGEVQDTVALSAMKVAAKPYIYSRAQWGANERLRDQARPSLGTVKAGFIHHTVNANSYSSAQVPALLRGIYAYHTQSRGWRDIGYNFLVDRFGRIWEGRYGGVGSPVVGAHTLGYNEVSFAMSAIGNFDIAAPPQAVLSAYARLFAWKLSLYNIPANAPRVYVKNRWLPAINGHRDVGQTACPGRYLYAKLPYVRTVARSVQNNAQSGTPTPPAPPPTGTTTTDPKCPGSAVNRRAYRQSNATIRRHLTLPLQCLLKQQGLYPYAVTGSWNAQTVAGIRAFQARVRHPVQSSATRRDWVSLLSAGSTGRVLARGSSGADVVRLQRALNAAVSRRLPVTGHFGPRTRNAVGAYQRKVGIRATKVVAAQTWSALRAGRW